MVLVNIERENSVKKEVSAKIEKNSINKKTKTWIIKYRQI